MVPMSNTTLLKKNTKTSVSSTTAILDSISFLSRKLDTMVEIHLLLQLLDLKSSISRNKKKF